MGWTDRFFGGSSVSKKNDSTSEGGQVEGGHVQDVPEKYVTFTPKARQEWQDLWNSSSAAIEQAIEQQHQQPFGMAVLGTSITVAFFAGYRTG
jgi:hypothetical protein